MREDYIIAMIKAYTITMIITVGTSTKYLWLTFLKNYDYTERNTCHHEHVFLSVYAPSYTNIVHSKYLLQKKVKIQSKTIILKKLNLF